MRGGRDLRCPLLDDIRVYANVFELSVLFRIVTWQNARNYARTAINYEPLNVFDHRKSTIRPAAFEIAVITNGNYVQIFRFAKIPKIRQIYYEIRHR